MKLLALETSTESCSVALGLDGEVRERFELAPRGHAELLLPWVEGLLAEAGVALSDLDAIAFGRGPGSFTALRIGIGVTQGLAWGADRPVVPVSSLQAAAQASGAERALVALDARMGEVFTGRFVREDGLMRPVGDEAVLPPESVSLPQTSDWTAVGNGFERYAPLAEQVPNFANCEPDTWPRAAAVLALAKDWMADNEPLPAEQAQPVYLRDKVASKPGER